MHHFLQQGQHYQNKETASKIAVFELLRMDFKTAHQQKSIFFFLKKARFIWERTEKQTQFGRHRFLIKFVH